MEDLTDRDIAEKLREENYEQYKQLVRMHLSFELDLNTDEFDLPCHEVIYYEKGKMKKWSRLTKKIKSCTSSKTGCGSPVEGSFIQLTLDLIEQLRYLRDFLVKEVNLKQEGIFRRTGAVSRQNELRNLINQNKIVELSGNYTVHDCATVYKSFLADLQEPLLTDAHYPAHCQIADLCNGVEVKKCDKKETNNIIHNKEMHLLHTMQLLVLLLPFENRLLLEDIIKMLNEASKYEEFNKMSPDSLATLFSPHLICPRNLPPEALHYVSQRMSSVISYMIFKGEIIFEIPPKLATDIRAYFIELKRKKTMSPEHILDESISDISTVNTVYTFVDREKTAAEHDSNPTDTALAQLYAHIQSLPESSKKRKLIKQFNKENGQGTPLQMLLVNRMKNNELSKNGGGGSGKSFSETIKKHIFHKGLISRTPKRLNSSNNSINNPSTPSGANKISRTRTLFPSLTNPSNLLHHTPQKDEQQLIIETPSPNLYGRNIKVITKPKQTQNATQYHPLHKSISASSILSTDSSLSLGSTSSLNIVRNSNELASKQKSVSDPICVFSSSNDCVIKTTEQPISIRITKITVNEEKHFDMMDCTSKENLIDDLDFNSDDDLLLDTQEQNDNFQNYTKDSFGSSENDIVSKNLRSILKSKYKSEPNLFNMDRNMKNVDAHNAMKQCNATKLNENEDCHENKKDGKLMDCLPKTIKYGIKKAVSLGSLIGNLSSSGIGLSCAQQSSNSSESKPKYYSKRFNASKVDNKKKNFRRLGLNDESADSFKDCLSTIQSESEIDLEHEPSCSIASESDDNVDGHLTKNLRATFENKLLNITESEEIGDTSLQTENIEINMNLIHNINNNSSENLIGSYPNLNIYRNFDLITSTPSQFCRRRSMSPITKSTQRMPKAMQESIMTPRSRKPVMLMTTTAGSSAHDRSQTVLQSDLSSNDLVENQENCLVELSLTNSLNQSEANEINKSLLNNKKLISNVIEASNIITQHSYSQRNILSENNFFVGCSEMEPKSIAEAANISRAEILKQQQKSLTFANLPIKKTPSLSNTFREYLLSRSVLTGSPVDSSFSSHPDDFGSTPDIQDLNESQLSSSLLYCLDGNKPVSEEKIHNPGSDDSSDAKQFTLNYHELGINISNCDNIKKLNNFIIDVDDVGKCFKSSKTIEVVSKHQQIRKRNCNSLLNYNHDNLTTNAEEIFSSKKLLIIEENPNETSL